MGSVVDAVYTVKVNAPLGVDVTVSPNTLVFSGETRHRHLRLRLAELRPLLLTALGQLNGLMEVTL